MSSMKKYILAIIAAFTLAACNKPYEEHYPELILDNYSYTLNQDGGSLHIMVYYSDSWRAEVSCAAGTDWIQLSRAEASGQAYMRITYASAQDIERVAYIDFYPSDGEAVQLILTQPKK